MARLARLLCVSAGVAMAVWLLPASIHIIDWPASGPVRVALFAPLWQLVVGLAVSLIAALALSTAVRHRGRSAAASDAVIRVFNPLGLLWLWVVPYLPWLPDRAPALLALAGPLRWGVLAVALGGSAAAFLSSRDISIGVAPPIRRAVFAGSFAVYLLFGLWSANAVGPGADEPHYLVITQSLLRDGDLAIENNHARGDYREYFGGDLRPDFLQRGLNEVIYSIHAPGLPALLMPAYAVGGYPGAVVMLCLIGALAAVAMFDLAALLAGPAAAAATWAAVCLTVPFVPHSWLIFPEMPGALLTAWAALWLCAPLPARARTWLWRGLALALLPWLHTKFVILLAAMVAALLLRVRRQPKAAAALVAPAIVSVGLWILSFHFLYGSWDPQVPYGGFPKLYVLFANIPRGLLGLLFDQKFGLLIYAPIYAIAIAGAWLLVRRPDRRWFALALIATAGAFVVSTTRMYMWWGGSSAPARFLVPILPLLAPFVAVAFDQLRPALRTAAALLLFVSLAVAAFGVVSPQRFLLFSAPHGLANLVDATQGPAPLTYLLPTFTEGQVRAPLALLAPWAIAALLALAAALQMRRASAIVATFAIVGAMLAGAPAVPSQRDATALRGRLDLMRDYDGPARRAYDYARGTTLDDGQLLTLGAVRLTAGTYALPAGRFTARAASAQIMLGATPLPSTFSLPVDATVSVVESSAAGAASEQSVDLVAESIVPRRARPDVDVHAIEAIDRRPGAFIVYGDSDSYPEGGVFWTRATSAARMFVAPGGAATLLLTLHVGPNGGPVRLIVDHQDRSLTLARDQTQTIEMPLPPNTSLVPIEVQAPAAFRPSDQGPGSTDRRWLGVQMRIGLR